MDFEELYIEEVERIAAELEEAGEAPDRAYDLASDSAYAAAQDRYADWADHHRRLAKDAGL